MSKRRTYLDTGVILAVVRSEPGASVCAYSVMNDPTREFVASDPLRLELLPNAIYFNNQIEQQICEAYLDGAAHWVKASRQLFAEAYKYACAHGLGAMDALHLAAAVKAGATEFITTEKPTKPLYRIRDIKVIHLLSI